jgi:hypothetical protein
MQTLGGLFGQSWSQIPSSFRPQVANPMQPAIPQSPSVPSSPTDPYAAQRAAAAGAARSASASSAAAASNPAYNPGAGAQAMNSASSMAASPASINPNDPTSQLLGPGGMPNSASSIWPNVSQYVPPFTPPGQQAQANPILSQPITMDSIAPYMNPFVDSIINSGVNAIAHSGASNGLFGSTGNINDIGTFATNARAQAVNDAVGRMLQDRGYFSDQAWQNYNANTNAADKAMANFQADRNFISNRADTAWNQGMQEKMNDQDMYKYLTNTSMDNYWKQINDYNTRMSSKESRDANMASVGPNSAQNAVNLSTSQGQALANLALALAEFRSKAASAQGQSDTGFVDAIVNAVSSLVKGK